MVFAGGPARCAGDRQRVPRHGHGGGRGGGVERGAVLGAQELQGAGGEDPARLREPHTTRTSEHHQVPPVLVRHSQRQAQGQSHSHTISTVSVISSSLSKSVHLCFFVFLFSCIIALCTIC